MQADHAKPGVGDGAPISRDVGRLQAVPGVAPHAARRHLEAVQPEIRQTAQLVQMVVRGKTNVGNGQFQKGYPFLTVGLYPTNI